MSQIEVEQLGKSFRVAVREGGFLQSLKGLVRRSYKQVEAVRSIDVRIEEGEVVGFLGPNGEGKTTTLKMLSGLLYPTSGRATVLGFTPWKREPAYLQQISMVMGQRSQLYWDLPAMDSFLVHLAIYRIDSMQGKKTLDDLIELLSISDIVTKQVRALSLGERMKCELCASLLHRPSVLFLDEPTLGLDITMQAKIRRFIADYSTSRGATIILTSHYMADVTALCKRIIIIDHGSILFDGPLASLSARLAPFKVIAIDLTREVNGSLERFGQVLSKDDRKITLRVPKDETASVTSRLLAELPVLDLTIEDPPIEDVISRVFAGGAEPKP